MHVLIYLAIFVSQFSVVFSNWWFLAMPSANQIISQISPRNYKEQCWNMPHSLLPEPRQRELCTLSENMLMVVSVGAKMALHECKSQFSSRRWDCRTNLTAVYQSMSSSAAASRIPGLPAARRGLHRGTGRMLADIPLTEAEEGFRTGSKQDPTKAGTRKTKQPAVAPVALSRAPPTRLDDLFGGVLNFDSREKAYVYAISSAGVAFSITRACRDGRLPSCRCDTRKRKRKPNAKKAWSWGGCSDHVRYGERISKDFVDSAETSQWHNPGKTLMNLHNNEAGRRALRKNMRRICRCHGVSGSCTMKMCWKQLRDFNSVGEYLKDKFDGATRVLYRKKRHRLAAVRKDIKKPTRRDLVYLQESPDYCRPNDHIGVSGTTGRVCNRTSYGMDGCLLMCCGRGYTTSAVTQTKECKCQFQWCCKVVCQRCQSTVMVYRCK